MTCKDGTTIDHHILARTTATTSILILTALDTDAIVARIELRIDNEGVLTRLQVERITVLGIGWVACKDIIQDNILAHQRMNVPSGGVLEDDTLQEHILAVNQRNHDGAQETLDGVPLLIGLSIGHIHVGTLLALYIALVGYPVAFLHLHTTRTAQDFLPLSIGHLRLLHGAPILTVTVNHTTPCNGDILSTIGTQRRLTTTGVEAFERGVDDGIERLVARELDDSAYLQVQVDVRLQHDRSCEPHALRNDQATATLL